ncbi:hypothetical protein ABSDF0644 [Acinetobacter baumannii SDF]|uniref:Response regulatory domain-containing protein n=1 Tax=Acinetobacter baumannii (strain SDF) TaxID=509170 RepID=B0VRY0_ACIBS|nr:hypothetical protein ABSDF0644 [Acinetobacter baumannii SDF]
MILKCHVWMVLRFSILYDIMICINNMPIIMITSRTGEKHRERAFSLGVSQYMGKPFQEEELLENIDALLVASESEVKS